MPPTWNGIVGPAGMPEPAVARLNAELVKALNLPEVKSKQEDYVTALLAARPKSSASA